MRRERITKPTLLTRENAINELFSKLFFYSLPVCPFMFILTKVGVFEIETFFCVLLTILLIISGLGMHFLNASETCSKYAKYFGIISLEIIIGFAATRATVGIYISYSFAVFLSCLYVSRTLTVTVNIISYIILLISLYFRSLDQIKHGFIVNTAWEYFISYALGYTLECVLLFLISLTVIKYEKMLISEKEEEVNKRISAELENKQKSEFLAEMSHEIRTPINAVMGMNEMILRETSDKGIITYANTIKSAGKSLLTIVNDILDFTKIQSGKLELADKEYDTFESMLDTINLYGSQASAKNLDFEIQIAEDIPEVLSGDEYRLKQVVGNLLSNAIKYTEKGFVNLRVDFKYDEEDDTNGDILISVMDSGVGIRAEDIPKLFKDYARVDVEKNRKIEGTGLGLKISKQLVDLMHGELNVSSVYGEGSVFSLKIPQRVIDKTPIGCFEERLSEDAPVEETANNKARVTAPDAEILIVDDNDMNLQVAASLLKRSEVKIDTAISGFECIDCVVKKHYDIIFLDHMMPDMDGIETLKKLRSAYSEYVKDTAIVVLTANAIKGAREKYLEEGFDDYVSKPIATEELERILTEYLPANKVFVHECAGIEPPEMLKPENVDKESAMQELSEYGLDMDKALDLMDGEVEVLIEMADIFIKDRAPKGDKMMNALNNGDMENYAILVHALKSNARTVGAFELGELAYVEELKSKEGDIEFINSDWKALFAEWDKVVEGLAKFEVVCGRATVEEEKEVDIADLPIMDSDECSDKMLMAMACIEEYQQEQAMEILRDILAHSISDDIRECVESVISELDSFMYDEAKEMLKSFLTEI
ncbi:MAG: response regulator [Lachnospiraceae bacterium]|nr:response regulator [Lachnospiraceae bacterium]